MLFFGRVEAYKGVDLLLAAANRQRASALAWCWRGAAGRRWVRFAGRDSSEPAYRRPAGVGSLQPLPGGGAALHRRYTIGAASRGVCLWQAGHRQRQRRAGGKRRPGQTGWVTSAGDDAPALAAALADVAAPDAGDIGADGRRRAALAQTAARTKKSGGNPLQSGSALSGINGAEVKAVAPATISDARRHFDYSMNIPKAAVLS